MARTIDIFVDSDQDLASFAGVLEVLLAIKLNEIMDDCDTWYEYSDGRVLMRVREHDFERDRDMIFEEYRFHVSIRAINIDDEEQRIERRTEFANKFFCKLKECAEYKLMMVDDLQTKLAEYDPKDDL